MKWFYNLKIRSKLLICFVLVALIAGFIGYEGILNLKKIDDADTALYEHQTVPIGLMSEIAVCFQRVRVNLRDAIFAETPAQVKEYADTVSSLTDTIDSKSNDFKKLIQTEDEKAAFEEFTAARKEFAPARDRVLMLASANNDVEAMKLMRGDALAAAKAEQDSIDKIREMKLKDAKGIADANSALANHSTTMMIIIIGIAMLAAICFGLFIAKIISNPLKKLLDAANKMAVGDADIIMDVSTKDELGDLSRAFDAMTANTRTQAETANMIAQGDLSADIQMKSDKDVLSKALQTAVDAIKGLIAEAGMLSKAAVEGKLDTRGNADKFQGGYKEIVSGVNDCLDSVIGPLNVAAEYVERISNGDIPAPITDNYNGDFNEIKNNLNKCIVAVNALVADANMLSVAAVEGKLDTRADASKHGGDFAKIVNGVNNTLDSVIGPLNVAAEYVERISNGDIPAPITDNYNGDFNEIKNNLNKCIVAVNALVADANMLSVAAVEGRLDTRADASKHGGDFGKIVKGVNDTLDTVVDKVYWYEAILDSVPMPLSVTDIDMKWTFINKSVEQMLGVKRADVVGKPCSNWNANICNTENCGIARLKHNQPQTFFNQMGGNFKVDTSYILNSKDERIGHIEFVQDITAMQKVTDFQKSEVEKLTGCLQSFADGDTSFTYVVSEADEFTGDTRNTFLPIESSLATVKNVVNVLSSDVDDLVQASTKGQLDTRADVSKHNGVYAKIVGGFNQALETIVNNFEAIPTPVQFMDKNFKIQYINKTGANLLGGTKQELLGKRCMDMWNTTKCRTKDCPCQVSMDTDSVYTCENDTKVGERRLDIFCAAAPLKDAQGQIIGSFEFVTDQTEVKTAMRVSEKVSGFQTDEASKLTDCLERMAKGDLSFDLVVAEADADTLDAKKNFDLIAGAVKQSVQAVSMLVNDAETLTLAAVEGRLDTRADASKHQGDFQKIVVGVNNTLDSVIGPLNVAAEYVERISNGDIPALITDNYNGDFNEIKNNLNKCIIAVNALVADANMLSVAAVEGKLDTRADASKHGGDFGKIVKGVNDCLDSVIGPLNVAAEYVERISNGDIPAPITDNYNGDFNEIKNNLNKCVSTMSNLLAETDKIVKAAADGQLDTRADAGKFEGGWNQLVSGVNDTITNIVDPLNVTADYVDKVSKGIIPPVITKEYKGQYNVIKENLNTMVKMMSDLLAETDKIVKAAADGQLDTRADAGKFEGGWNQLVSGVNDTITNIVGPLNVSAEYVERISNGDIPALITDNYNGDFNEIKNNLNKCIIAVNALVTDANMLSVAAVEGRLDTRADASKHGGDFGKIVKGVNDCLDSVIGPLNVAAEYVDRISKGDIPAKITDSYNGDFNLIKNNLNQCIDGLGGLVEANAVLQLMSENDYTIPVKGEYQGIFANVAIAVNEVQERINHILSTVTKISLGDLTDLDAYRQIGGGKGKRCDNDKLAPAFIVMMESVGSMVSETVALAKAALEGALSTRADASQFKGDYRKVVESVNDCLDAVIDPVNEAAAVLVKLAQNDLTARVTGNYKGDHAKIKDSLNNALEALDSTMTQAAAACAKVLQTAQDVSVTAQDVGKASQSIADTINQVAAGSADQSKMVTTSSATMEQLVLAIDEVAKGAQSQAKTMEETASQVQQIAQAIESVARTAQSAAITSSDVADIAKAGGESVGKSVKGMARIKETSANVAVAITQLGDHSKRIGAIVETIDDIAEQTNLLALNAAIEAARAGEHGKGFAVVADEVRKLAERSSMATKEIAELIGNIQQMTEHAVEATQKGSTEVEVGTELANEAGEALTNILTAVNTIVQQIEDVSAASEQMSASSAEVMRAVESLSAITEESTAATEEMAASSTDVMRSIEQVAAVSEQNAASSQGVAAAAEEQNAAMEEMTAYADESGSIARDLQEVVAQFKVSENIEVRHNDDHVKGNGKSKTKVPAGSYRN